MLKAAIALFLATMLASGCDAPQQNSSPAAAPDPLTAQAPAVDLTGEWRVAGIDGAELDGAYGIALSADDGHIWWEPGCAGQGRLFAISGNEFHRIASPDTGPQMVCDIGFPDELAQIWRAIDAADTIERTAQNGVLITGGGHSLLLFSQ
ncbi:hypothetical protein [Qipengyuania marisflavi]|uniref:META domain-containing protein n=1 Tax=Qipengyuania marisflavi TaxID=2486356 RepID=A0A5S3P3K7_9SPHN|nr:hypothetical protein [Qipengyuania marisflavi]TMM46584.1 hypothetical protein FEV51_11120 [Qipengyuania marisflavi]